MMIFFRPIRSESAPKTTKNGVPSSSPIATILYEVSSGTLRIV